MVAEMSGSCSSAVNACSEGRRAISRHFQTVVKRESNIMDLYVFHMHFNSWSVPVFFYSLEWFRKMNGFVGQ